MADSPTSDHVEETVQRLVQMHEAHDRDASPMQRVANRVTGALGKPTFVATILLLIIVWMIGNYIASRIGVRALDGSRSPIWRSSRRWVHSSSRC
ncbi:hypothetical protein [Sphingomonas sp. CROZ-RG-20F-R02-07]|uniref:hypothetical protein n=1 Tax=Sphingomonas sp. CROZ-RG-20F-R02-07 TaxID=2914832 RepID=UPI001F586610|nr:hypothetical protein [Sphingomonas sp. CROZ-RG-20F-R02-07]